MPCGFSGSFKQMQLAGILTAKKKKKKGKYWKLQRNRKKLGAQIPFRCNGICAGNLLAFLTISASRLDDANPELGSWLWSHCPAVAVSQLQCLYPLPARELCHNYSSVKLLIPST